MLQRELCARGVGGAPLAPQAQCKQSPDGGGPRAPSRRAVAPIRHRATTPGRHLIKRRRDGEIYVCIVQLIFRAPLKLLVWGTCSTPRVGEIRRGESGAAGCFQCARAPAFAAGWLGRRYLQNLYSHTPRIRFSLSTSLLTRCGPRPAAASI